MPAYDCSVGLAYSNGTAAAHSRLRDLVISGPCLSLSTAALLLSDAKWHSNVSFVSNVDACNALPNATVSLRVQNAFSLQDLSGSPMTLNFTRSFAAFFCSVFCVVVISSCLFVVLPVVQGTSMRWEETTELAGITV